MKYEPLKGKERVIQYIGYIRRMDGGIYRIPFIKKGFLTDDVKSAVQGLLEEIEERIQECIEDKKRFEPKDRLWNSFDGQLIGLEKAEDLIKKWFADVINKEEER